MKLPEPFLGTILIELLEENIDKYIEDQRGLDANSELKKKGFTIEYAETVSEEEKHITGREYKKIKHYGLPIQKGTVVAKSQDAFGEAFQNRYGSMEYYPQEGDTVYFIPGQVHKVDNEGKFGLINDEDIKAIIRKEEVVNG